MTQPETIKIDNTEYVRADLAQKDSDELAGLRYAIVRSRDQGVMAGYVESIEGRTVTLRRARQLWRYDSRFVLPDLAEYGVRNAENCRFSCEMSQPMVMLEACGVIYCTEVGGKSIRAVPAVENE